MTTALFLTSDELTDLAEPRDYVEAVREGYREHGTGEASAQPRTKLQNSDPPGMFTGYTAILPKTGTMGGYTYSAGFSERDAWFVTPLFDSESGEPLAILDGAYLNPFKTGAVGAVGVDALARKDASTVGLIGSGAQARGQLRAVAEVRDLDFVRVYSTTRENREEFVSEMDAVLDCEVGAVESSSDAVSDAEIVVTATNSSEPVFDGDLLEPGTHVTAMGQYDTEKHDLDSTTVSRAKYVLDLRERMSLDAGSLMAAFDEGAIDGDHLHGELGEVLAGVVPGREREEEITVFDSGGTGIETVAAASMLYECAREAGRGTEIEFAPASEAMPGR